MVQARGPASVSMVFQQGACPGHLHSSRKALLFWPLQVTSGSCVNGQLLITSPLRAAQILPYCAPSHGSLQISSSALTQLAINSRFTTS